MRLGHANGSVQREGERDSWCVYILQLFTVLLPLFGIEIAASSATVVHVYIYI